MKKVNVIVVFEFEVEADTFDKAAEMAKDACQDANVFFGVEGVSWLDKYIAGVSVGETYDVQ